MALEKYNVKFTATLAAPSSRPSQDRGRKSIKGLETYQECPVHIVVYGLKSEMSAVGDEFSNAGLYFQQPSAAECDRSIEYSNPHYLVRPGSSMPKLEGLSISSNVRQIMAPEKLEEVNRSRLARIFDTANGNDVQPQILTSLRLCTSLKE